MILTIPRAQIPFTQGQDLISREWYRFFQVMAERVGGVEGASTGDLEGAAFEDAGIEETKLELYRLRDEVQSLPPVVWQTIEQLTTELAGVRSELAEMQKTIEGLQSGLTL